MLHEARHRSPRTGGSPFADLAMPAHKCNYHQACPAAPGSRSGGCWALITPAEAFPATAGGHAGSEQHQLSVVGLPMVCWKHLRLALSRVASGQQGRPRLGGRSLGARLTPGRPAHGCVPRVPATKRSRSSLCRRKEEACGRARFPQGSRGQTLLQPRPGHKPAPGQSPSPAASRDGAPHHAMLGSPGMLLLGLGTHQSSPQKTPGPRTQASAPQDTVWRGVRSAASSPSGTGLPSHLHQPGHVLSVTQQRCVSCHSQPWHTASPRRTALSQLRGHAGAPGGDVLPPWEGAAQGRVGCSRGLSCSAAKCSPSTAR